MPKEKRKYIQRAEYLKEAVKRRRKELRLKAINYLGGECSICKYHKCLQALEFHHLNSRNKSFGLSSRGLTRSWERIKSELDKCILLCANCHRELHSRTSERKI